MFAIVKSCEGWTVRDEEFGVVIDTYTRLLDAQARINQIAENTAIVESFSQPSSHDIEEPCDCCLQVDCVCLSGGCGACNATEAYYAARGE